jgi:predicted nucleic acid-binding protein
MITAIDTNILLDILIPNESFYESSAEALEQSSTAGSLVICDLVYAELCVHFPLQKESDAFLAENEVRVEHLTREALFQASRAWRTYRRQGGQRNRILADFMIGAHAQHQASRLLSRDRGFYRNLFPKLEIFNFSSPRRYS